MRSTTASAITESSKSDLPPFGITSEVMARLRRNVERVSTYLLTEGTAQRRAIEGPQHYGRYL